ncbi:MAG: zinc-binding alcohol dehydrogenase [Caldilineaceae bacterium]|nr:zinc-binding alcohol dehydrogenase [Caldilineaceae bacterium]HRJ45018.1 zinc-binding alcohol dehydrogenase [Caldilineaceae bacterium]
MPRGLFVDAPQHAILADYTDALLQPDQVRFRAEFAAVKHGTMFHIFSGESPFQEQRFDPALRLFVPTPPDAPNGAPGFVGQFIGNMAVGEVTDVGGAVAGFAPGDRVYCYGPVAETVTKSAAALHHLPPELSPGDAVCLDPALYAYAALRDARISLGDRVAVSGMGAIGLSLIQLLARAGCGEIVAVDPLPKRRALAQRYGATATLDPAAEDVGLAVRRLLGGPADVAIEASGNYRALYGAMRSVGKCGRIVTLGYYKGDHSHLPFGAEWHHNRLELISSMPVWDNPSREAPHWDLARLEAAVVDFYRRGWLTSAGLADPIVPFAQAAESFMDTFHDPTNAIKLCVQF